MSPNPGHHVSLTPGELDSVSVSEPQGGRGSRTPPPLVKVQFSPQDPLAGRKGPAPPKQATGIPEKTHLDLIGSLLVPQLREHPGWAGGAGSSPPCSPAPGLTAPHLPMSLLSLQQKSARCAQPAHHYPPSRALPARLGCRGRVLGLLAHPQCRRALVVWAPLLPCPCWDQAPCGQPSLSSLARWT